MGLWARIKRLWAMSSAPAPPQPLSPDDVPLVFKANDDLFTYTCDFGDTRIEPKKAVLARVCYPDENAIAKHGVARLKSGMQLATLRVAAKGGGFVTIAETAGRGGPNLRPGDLVMWLPMEISDRMKAVTPDPRGWWIGLIVAKVAAELPWRVLGEYRN